MLHFVAFRIAGQALVGPAVYVFFRVVGQFAGRDGKVAALGTAAGQDDDSGVVLANLFLGNVRHVVLVNRSGVHIKAALGEVLGKLCADAREATAGAAACRTGDRSGEHGNLRSGSERKDTLVL